MRPLLQVSDTTLRRIFNTHYLGRVNSGELKAEVLREGHPSPPLAGEPFCTKSQLLAYRDKDGNLIAKAHRYLRPDGTIGLSGKPDPKTLLHKGILYTVAVSPKPENPAGETGP